MAQTGFPAYSKTAASNATADSAQNWAEGMAPSAVNDSARGGMASMAKWRDDTNGSIATTGTSTAYAITTNTGMDAFVADYVVAFQIDEDCGTPVTLNVDSKGAKPLRSAPNVELVAGALKAGGIYSATYKTSNSGEWILQNVTPTILADGQVATAKIADAAVTNAKLANMANATVKGRATSGTGVPEDIALGQGLVLSGTTLIAPAFPPSGAFKSLAIKVTGNTGLTASADYVATTDGTNFQTTALSSTINMGTTGANALDSGSIAQATWYAIWAIAKADGTTAGLASTSFTSPTMPSGYTYKARIGAVRTAAGTAQLLGTWQFGRRAQYVVGLAQTTQTSGIMASGSTGSVSTPTWTAVSVSNFVPASASAIRGFAHVFNGSVIVAPSGAYAGNNDTNTGPPLAWNFGPSPSQSHQFDLLLESTNVYWASDNANGRLYVLGWDDNL